MDKRTYTIYPLSRWIAGEGGGYKSVFRIKFYLYWKIFFGGGVGFVLFNEKGSKGKKVLLQDMQIFFKNLKLIFDRICIPPPKKDWGIQDFCCPFGSFVHPIVTLFRLSNTLLNFARTGLSISVFFYFNSSPFNRLDVALMVPKFKRNHQVKRTDSR